MVKCNLCHLGKCDEELNYHVGTHFIECSKCKQETNGHYLKRGKYSGKPLCSDCFSKEFNKLVHVDSEYEDGEN
jgi:hypothetical protein